MRGFQAPALCPRCTLASSSSRTLVICSTPKKSGWERGSTLSGSEGGATSEWERGSTLSGSEGVATSGWERGSTLSGSEGVATSVEEIMSWTFSGNYLLGCTVINYLYHPIPDVLYLAHALNTSAPLETSVWTVNS